MAVDRRTRGLGSILSEGLPMEDNDIRLIVKSHDLRRLSKFLEQTLRHFLSPT